MKSLPHRVVLSSPLMKGWMVRKQKDMANSLVADCVCVCVCVFRQNIMQLDVQPGAANTKELDA